MTPTRSRPPALQHSRIFHWLAVSAILCAMTSENVSGGGNSDRSGADEAPVAAPRPDHRRMMTLADLDRLLRNADVAVDVRQPHEHRWRALAQLGESRSRFGRPALLAVVHRQDDDPQLRRVAAEALANLDDACVVEDLIDLLRDHEPGVAFTAAKGLQQITNREGPPDRLPTQADSPARAGIQQNWRLWWKPNRQRFEPEHKRELASLQALAPADHRRRAADQPQARPVVAAFLEERLDLKGRWVKVKDDEVSWSHDRTRRMVLFANVPGVKHVRWLAKPWDDRDNPDVPWREFASAPSGRPAEGSAGVGQWAITAEIEFDDGRKLLVGSQTQR